MIERSWLDVLFSRIRKINIHHYLSFMTNASIVTALVFLSGGVSIPPEFQADSSDPVPLLAYYYIWYDEQSWDRAKVDYPLLGRYSSDDPAVMRQHIEWAKGAGIDGFIVSWKSTDKLNSRLEQLIRLADQENFKLAIIYEALDFYRNPLPVKQVEADLDFFIKNYADHPAFDLYPKPMIILSGSWEFSRSEIQSIMLDKRDQLLVLASERNLDGYRRLSDLVDGDAYYWSSVNPDTYPGYPEKLNAMSALVHASGGLWIAPAAPGYDSRLVGGETVVDRKNGETLKIEMNTALQSSPDAIGLISWNEFSENSHVEPSEKYGDFYLKLLTEMRHTKNTSAGDFDSSIPGDILSNLSPGRVIALALLVTLILTSFFVIVRRNRSNSMKDG